MEEDLIVVINSDRLYTTSKNQSRSYKGNLGGGVKGLEAKVGAEYTSGKLAVT